MSVYFGYNINMSYADPTPPPATPYRLSWQRLFQFRLRTILILTTVIAIGLAWWSHKARQQRATVAALQATVIYDFHKQSLIRPPLWPEWIVETVGVDYFANAEEVTGVSTQFADAGLEHLKRLTALQKIDLGNTRITDNGLEHVTRLRALRELHLYNTKITDAGLESLKGLTVLTYLDLRHTLVTDAGVARLKKSLPNCTIER